MRFRCQFVSKKRQNNAVMTQCSIVPIVLKITKTFCDITNCLAMQATFSLQFRLMTRTMTTIMHCDFRALNEVLLETNEQQNLLTIRALFFTTIQAKDVSVSVKLTACYSKQSPVICLPAYFNCLLIMKLINESDHQLCFEINKIAIILTEFNGILSLLIDHNIYLYILARHVINSGEKKIDLVCVCLFL